MPYAAASSPGAGSAARRRRWVVLLPALVVLLAFLAAPVGGSRSAAAAEDTERGRMVLVLDSSGSMAEPAGGGATRIEAAREGLTRVVDALPADAQVGMRVFGATVFEESMPGACEDSQLVVPLGADNRDALRAAIAAYQPYGETPIGYALRQAAGDVGPAGPRTVVLVSDGEDTCAPPPPCEVAAELRAQGIDLRIDVVGLDVGGSAREQLMCIAQAGGGEYVDAADAGEIAEALETVATRAVRPFELTGQPVDGTLQRQGAPVLEPGRYLDELPARDQEIFYELSRSAPGSTLWVSATLRNTTFAGAVYVRTYAGEVPCGSSYDLEIGVLGIRDVVSTATGTWQEDPASPCNTADRIVVGVRHAADELVGQPFELRVTQEPPVSEPSALPPAADANALPWTPMPAGPPGAVVSGGTSFDTAVPLTPGIHALELVPGEIQVFSATLDWGQRLQAVATLPPRTGALAEAADWPLTVTAKIFGPDRAVARAFTNSQGRPQTQTATGDSVPSVAVAETVPVTYLNRSRGGSEPSTSRAGHYVITVALSRDAQGATYVAPATLEIAVVGTPVDPPPYALDSVIDSVTATDEPTTSATSEPEETPDDDAQDDGGVPGWLLAVGAAVLVATAAAALVLLRRRSAD